MFATPDAFKSLLNKSAFDMRIYGDMPPDYYMSGIELTSQLVRLHNVEPKPYQTHDVYLMYYQPYETVVEALRRSNRSAPAWLAFIRGLIRSTKYYSINQLTRGSTELSAAAAVRTLSIIANTTVQAGRNAYDIETLNKMIREQNNAAEQEADPQKYATSLEELAQSAGEQVALEQVAEELRQYLEARGEAEAAAAALAGHGYSLGDLSIWRFLQSPDEFRRRVRLLSAAAQALRLFSRALPTSLSHQISESLWGGVDGVTRMQSYAQLSKILPSELAMSRVSRLFMLKLAQLSLMVYRQTAAVRPVIFVDKSGSMADLLQNRDVPKISMAAGLALALHKRFNGIVYLFDTEVEAVSPREVVKMLLAIQADGGTAIDPVLEEVLKIGRRDYIYLIISDGITEASDEVLRRFIASGLAKQVRVMLVPPSEDNYNWIAALRRQGGRVVKATDVATFMAAARQALS
jgi:uncharacterized protein with von Willebrand factor type A (vWA) domain